MQQAANERLLQQAEEHRALAQKQFTEGMARMQAEQEKTITEAARIRDDYVNSAKKAQVSYDVLMNRVEVNQSSNVVSLQMACLLKRTQKHERELQEIHEKHEEELQDKEDLCKRYKRDLERALSKTKALEQEKKDFEEQLMTGVVPQVNANEAKPDSADSSPELRSHKRPKMDIKPEQGSSSAQMTTAYTLSAKDELNMKIVIKDPSSIVDTVQSSSVQAKAASNPKGEVYSRAYDKEMLSTGSTLRSETRGKPVNTYPAMHPRARDHYMEQDTKAAAIVHDATIQAKADKAKPIRRKPQVLIRREPQYMRKPQVLDRREPQAMIRRKP
jgi:hypothetical protein